MKYFCAKGSPAIEGPIPLDLRQAEGSGGRLSMWTETGQAGWLQPGGCTRWHKLLTGESEAKCADPTMTVRFTRGKETGGKRNFEA
jgi:hypothetical protein